MRIDATPNELDRAQWLRMGEVWARLDGGHSRRCVAAVGWLLLILFSLAGAATAADQQPRMAKADEVGESESAGPLVSELLGPAADRVLRARSQGYLADPGRTLAAAVEALRNGDRAHAVWLFEEVIRRHPIVDDHAALLQARVLQQDGELEAAEATLRRALSRDARSGVRADLYTLFGEVLAQRHEEEGAFAAWRAALNETRDAERRASILLSIATTEERTGRDEEAATTYKLIWYAHPTTDEARIASHRLEVLEEFLGRSQRDGIDWRRRGDRLFRSRRNQEALDAYDRALESGLSRAERRRAERQRAHALFRERRYPEAVEAFGKLPQQEDVPIWLARSRARAGDVPQAIREFERIAEKKRGTMSARGRFLAALLLDGRGYTERARQHYLAVAESRMSGGMGDAASWRLGWAAYREGRYEQATAHFDHLIIRKQGDGIGQLRPRYWRARALERRGDERAGSEFAAVAREYPVSYYGWRARERAAPSDELPPLNGVVGEGRAVLGPRDLARPRILLQAGLVEQAREDLRRLVRRARGLSERLELAQLCTEVADYYSAQRVVVDPYSETLARGPRAGLEELWWYAWPSAYSQMVDEVTRGSDGVEPELVYSIMREESGYRAKVVSPVGARGLLQIMAATGERLARSKGLASFAPDDLFEPRTNIGLGSHYLGELARQFEGRLSASIASYNAGPAAVEEWKLASADRDDEWVEAIPYDQTRSYVKRVLRSLHAYRVLY